VCSGLPFVPLTVESFWRLWTPALSLLHSLADPTVQAGGPGLSQDAFISGALRELGIALCRGKASLGWSACMPSPGCSAGPRCAAYLVPQLWWSEVVRGCLLDSRLG
jgi:hypothetical protein